MDEWIVFVVWLTNERRLALFPDGTIVIDPHHRESPTCREQGLNLRRAWIRLSWMKVCSSDNHYTTTPTPEAVEFSKRLEFNQNDIIITKEQSMLTKIMKVFSREIILLQHYVLNVYKIYLYFPEDKLATEVDENGHIDRNKHKQN